MTPGHLAPFSIFPVLLYNRHFFYRTPLKFLRTFLFELMDFKYRKNVYLQQTQNLSLGSFVFENNFIFNVYQNKGIESLEQNQIFKPQNH